MTAAEVVRQLEPLGSESTKKVLRNHGVAEPLLGVKIGDLQKIQKRVKTDHPLALDLYDTGIYDAMYLAGMIADPQRMTKDDLRRWLEGATCAMLAEHTVPTLAARSPHGRELAMEWIESPDERTAAAGWQTLSMLLGDPDEADVDVPQLKRLLQRVRKTIHDQPNHVRYVMNGFVIAVGSYVTALTDAAIEAGKAIGKVDVDMGNTACKVPYAPDYIEKVRKRRSTAKTVKKRKSMKS
jgi:3-methyladenine DNA glycosylase AlkD